MFIQNPPLHAQIVQSEPHVLPALSQYPKSPFEAALAAGFYLRARERMTYLSVRSDPDDPLGWMIHRFVSFEGRLIGIRLPPTAQIYVWPVGRGPRPYSSICCRERIWGRMPGLSTEVDEHSLRRLKRLWHRSQSSIPAQRSLKLLQGA